MTRLLTLAFVLPGLLLGCGSAVDQNDSGDAADGDDGAGGDTGSAEAAEFEYVPLRGARCGNGSPLGIGVSERSGAEELTLFFNGGGACWDDLTCFGLNAAAHLWTDYDEKILAEDLAPLRNSGLLDRTPGSTPFSESSLVFVPYCTGDLFFGAAERDYQADVAGQDVRHVFHVGRANVEALLLELRERFPRLTRVHLLGASAGGYGAILNYDRIAETFAEARVDLLADGALAIEPIAGRYQTWREQWAFEGPDCEGCTTSISAVVRSLHAAHPDRRFALLTSRNDQVIRTFFGYGFEDIGARVDALVTDAYQLDNAHAFVVDGSEHVLLGGYRTRSDLGGFVDGWAAGSEDFRTSRP